MLRRCAALMLVIMLMGVARAQSAYVAGDRLVDPQGRALASGEAVFTVLEDALYAVGEPGRYALTDASGTPLNGDTYEMLEVQGDAVVFRQNGLCGALDLTGGALVAPEWTQLTWAGTGAFLALEGDPYDDQPDELIRVTADGERDSTGSFTARGLGPFRDGRMAFMQSDGQYGYVDALGRQVIPPQWDYGGEFQNGAAIVSDGSGMGLINVEGQVLVAPVYTWMARGKGMIAARTSDGVVDVYTADGTEKLYTAEAPCDAAEVCGGCVVLRDADAARLYDRSGVCLCEASEAALFYPGLEGQVIVADGEWGELCQYLINGDGSTASKRFQRLLPLTGDRYAYMTMLTGDLGWDYDTVRWGLMDACGTVLLPAEYDEIRPCGEDRLLMMTGEKVLFADTDGQTIVEWPVSETAGPSSEAGA